MVNHVERAYRAWPILVKCAARDTPITYGDLGSELRVHHRAIRYVLGVIQDYCLGQQLPPLTILVINSVTRMPGPGFIAWDMDDLDRGRAEVSAFAWQTLDNPFEYAADGTTEDDLIETIVSDPDSASDMFGRIKVRGMAQMIFRKVLLHVYGGRCALCGLTFEDALEASHLVPWGEASPQERLDPRNGLLLCSTHHSLFDASFITITRSGLIAYSDPKGKDGRYSSADKALTIALHGKRASLPRSAQHRPSDWALARHHEIHEWGDLP
ncbi:MAG: HNH endonuclease [Xanthobacteraceae bacterium]